MGSRQQEQGRMDVIGSVFSALGLGGSRASGTVVGRRYKGPPPRHNRLKEAGGDAPPPASAPEFEPPPSRPPERQRTPSWSDPQESVLELSSPSSSAKDVFIAGAGQALDALFDSAERAVPAAPSFERDPAEPVLDLGGGRPSFRPEPSLDVPDEPVLELGRTTPPPMAPVLPDPAPFELSTPTFHEPEPPLDLPFLVGVEPPVESPVSDAPASAEPDSLPPWLLAADEGTEAPPAPQPSGLFSPGASAALDAFFDDLDSRPTAKADPEPAPEVPPSGGLFTAQAGFALDAFFDALDAGPSAPQPRDPDEDEPLQLG